jgi:hypothetical protein
MAGSFARARVQMAFQQFHRQRRDSAQHARACLKNRARASESSGSVAERAVRHVPVREL